MEIRESEEKEIKGIEAIEKIEEIEEIKELEKLQFFLCGVTANILQNAENASNNTGECSVPCCGSGSGCGIRAVRGVEGIADSV